MSNKNLAGKALQFIYRYWKNHNHEYPTSGEISRALGKTTAQWGNIRTKLIEKGLLKPSLVWGIELTDQGFAVVRENEERDNIQNIPLPIESNQEKSPVSVVKQAFNTIKSNFESPTNYVDIRLFGDVKAGPGAREDDLEYYSGEETVSVPDQIGDPTRYYALQVQGESMIHENIFPGDIVIVKKIDFGELKEQDLIVVKYLDNKYFNKKAEEINLLIQNREFLGPTLKYFNRLKRGDKRASYRLSWKTEAEDSKFKIDTPYIAVDEIGLVVAVYSPENFRMINKSR
jgi:SOS-response transcriptional repressor LexA